MLKIENINKSYGPQTLFDGVTFNVNPGERVGLVGRNGHGKTTLFRMILGAEEPDEGIISIPKRYTVGHLSQHIRFSEETVLKEAALALAEHEDGVDETYKVKAILHGLGMTDAFFDLPPSALSGGFQIRLNLAKVLASEPSLLLLDEPTNYLDIVSLRWLKGFLRNWENELMLITHDRGFMDAVTTHTLAIHRRKAKKIAGSTEKLYAQIAAEEEIYEKTRLGEEKIRKEAESFINRFRAQATKASSVQSRIKALEKRATFDRLEEMRDLDFEFKYAPYPGKELLRVEDVSFAYPGGERLIDSLGFSVGKSDRLAVIGPNGKGKTTLLNLIAGGLKPIEGAIDMRENVKTAYFGQTNIERLMPGKTVLQELMDTHPDCTMAIARRIAGGMMFSGDDALKKIDVLSGGERSRVMLGKILASPANLLLLDEPTNHLDMQSVDSLVDAVDAFEGAVIMVTHSESIIKRLATRLVVFDRGRVFLFDGTYDDFLEKVGWSSDDEAGGDAATGPKKGRPSLNKKELRRFRAELLTARQKATAAIQKRIDEVERNIVALEGAASATAALLVKACEMGLREDIARLSKEDHDAKEKIEALFSELETLTSELRDRAKEYEERLSMLD